MSTVTIASAPRRSVGDAMAAELRAASIVVVSCAVAGAIVGGIGSRVVMRLSALAAPEARGMATEAGNMVGEITLSGTVGLMLFAGIASAVFGAGASTVLRPWLPRGTVSRGLVIGLFLLALLGGVVIDPANADFVLLGDRALNVAMFSTLFIAFGLVASGTAAFLEARIARAPALSPRGWAVSLLVALPIVPGVAAVAFGFAWQLGVPLVASSLAMAVSDRTDRARRGAAQRIRIAATAVMATVILVAGAAYVDDVATIL